MNALVRSSVQNNRTFLDETYIEYQIVRLFHIDIINLIKIKAQLCKEFHISPLEIDKLPFWEYELFMKELSNLVQEQNEEQQAQMDKYHVNDAMKMANPKNMNKMMNPQMPKMPTVSMPKI